MPDKAKRRVGFMRAEEKKLEDKRMRAANHVQKCEEFAEEIYQLLLIQSPDQADTIIKFINNNLY